MVTGAGTGIGRAVALALAEAGAFVGVHFNTSADEARATLDAIRRSGVGATLLQAHLTREAEAAATVDRLLAEAGRLDVLVNNAGSPLRGTTLADCPCELWRQAFDVNVHAAF